MKVCHFVASTGLGRGDSFVDLVNALADHAEMSLVCPVGSRFLQYVDPRVKIHLYHSGNSRHNPLLLLEIYRLVSSIKPDIVHTHFAKATEIYHTVARFCPAVHVATKHNPRKGKIFNRIRHVVAVSQGVESTICAGDVRVIYNGIRPVTVPSSKRNSTFTMIAVGRLDRVKGFDDLVCAVAELPFDFELNIVGEGDERTALETLIHDLGVESKVRLLGYRTDIPQLLAAADLQIISSHSEGFSLAMVEGIFYSRVLISTDVSGANEVLDRKLIIDGRNIADKIANVNAGYEEYSTIFASVGAEFQEKLDISRTCLSYLDYYNELITANLKSR